MPVPRPFLRPILAAAFLSLSSLALAATGGWRAELDAAELYSDRNQSEAKSQLDVLREQFTVQKQDDALSYADAIDCFFLINTEPNKAPRFAEEALARAKALRYPDAFIRLTTCRGSAKEQTGNLDGARQDYQISIDLAREARRPLAQADAMGYLADLISYQGKAAESMALVREAVALLDSQPGATGDAVLQRIRRGLLGRMANIYVRTDEPAKAAAYYEQVLADDERLGNRQALISDLYNLGRSYEDMGDVDKGLETQRKALALAKDVHDAVSIAWAQRAIGAMLISKEQFAEAEPILRTALASFRGLDDAEMVGQLEYFLAKARAHAGDTAVADQLLAAAIATFTKNSNLRYLDFCLRDRAKVEAQRGNFEAAFRTLQVRDEVHGRLEKEIQSKAANKLRIQFDTEKMERENKALLANQKWQQDKLADSRKIERLQYLAIGLGGLLMLLLLVFVIRQMLAAQRLRTIAMTDELTGIANRRSIYSWAEQQVTATREANMPFSLLLIDIDFFKKINDEFGHPMGDHVLKQIATCCREQLRQMDRIGRVGGEEFMVILPSANEQAAAEVGERLRKAVDALPADNWASGMRVSISVGVAIRSSLTEPLAAMVQRADIALYRAKQGGRNRVEISA